MDSGTGSGGRSDCPCTGGRKIFPTGESWGTRSAIGGSGNRGGVFGKESFGGGQIQTRARTSKSDSGLVHLHAADKTVRAS